MRIFHFNRSLLLAVMIFALAGTSSAGIIFSIGIAPPPLPIYEQPLCPGDGYIWTPGYWAYDDVSGYFWVPGTWVLIPEPGLLWTPGYWGWEGAVFVFHEGYWGPHIGFYGGINYGFGYFGVGFAGGYWDHDRFFYNRAYSHIDHVTNVYNKTVVVNKVYVSYNGGAGGITARATAEEEAAMRDRHIPPSSIQIEHRQTASTNRELFESVNHGRPAIAATARPGEFGGRDVVHAQSAAPHYTPPTARGAAPEARANAPSRSGNPYHPNDLEPLSRPAPVNSGNAKADRQYQQQQDKLFAKQQQERQQLQQKQEREHQQFQSRPNPQKQQQLEQKHQQQTQQLQQRHASEQRQLESKAPQTRRR